MRFSTKLVASILVVIITVLSLLSTVSNLVSAQTCELPSCCNLTMRNTINASSGYPYCFKVGILIYQGASSAKVTREIPLELFNKSVENITHMMPVFYNQTEYGYDGGIFALGRNEFDAYIADIWTLSRRAKYCDFSVSMVREDMALGYPIKAATATTYTALFDPFEGTVWGLAVVLMIFAGLLLFLVEWMHPVSDDVPGPGGRLVYRFAATRSFLRCFDNAFMSPFSGGRFVPVSTAGALVIFGMKFFFLIFTESYVANLASFLTVSGAAARVTLAELLNQGILSQPNANVDFVQAAGGKVVTINSTSSAPDPQMVRDVQAGENPNQVGSYVQGSAILLGTMDTDCDARFLRLPFSVDTVIPFRSDNAVRAVRRLVDQTIMSLRQSGYVNELYDGAYLPKAQRCENSRFSSAEIPEDVSELKLGLDNMKGLFVITVGLMLVAIICAILFRLIAHCLYGTPTATEVWTDASNKIAAVSESSSGVEKGVVDKSGDAWNSHTRMMNFPASPKRPPRKKK